MTDTVVGRSARTKLIVSTSTGALVALLIAGATPALAQAGNVPDPANSSSTVANPNEAQSGDQQKAANAAVTGDVTPAQNEAEAQAVGRAAADAGADQATQDIVVTGFRRSLETAVAEKKTRDQIVESISAEDIGKLPDASIAESIARLPGLTSQRVAGRSQTISIRGFAPDFSTTLLNGREQTSTSDNRQVEFDQYPSEVVNQVLIYKTPQASIVGQGLAGTVDLRTIRPIEFGRRVVSVGGRGTYTDVTKFNPDSKRYGYRANGTYVDQFLDDRLGISLAASYIDEPYQFREFNAWGYNGAGPGGAQVIGGANSRATSTTLKRFGTAGTIEFRPVPEFTSTFDGFYSHFKDAQDKKGVELPLSSGIGDFFGTTYNPATSTVTDGTVTSGSFGGVQAIVRNDAQRNKADLYSFGWNNAYKGDDGWNAQLDISYSKTKRSELSLESYAGTGRGRARGANETIGFVTTSTGSVFTPQLDYTDTSLILLTDPAGYGGADVVQAGYFNDRRLKDRIWQVRGEVEKEIENFFLSSIRAGLNYTTRTKSLTPDEAFVTLPGGAQEAAIPAEFVQGAANISYAFDGIGRSVAYNPFALLDAGVITLIPRGQNQDVLAKAYSVKEDVMTGYVQANIRQPVGSSELTGNVGVQVVATEQKSTGLVFTPVINQQTQGTDYVDVLPSANLSFRTPSDFVFRLGASRQIARPRLDDLRIALSYGVDTGRNPAIIAGSAGNPTLKPYRAWAFDATIEKYFGTAGYIAVQGYYKDLSSFIYRNLETPFDYTGLPLPPGSPAIATTLGVINRPVNVSGGKLYGVELAGTLPLGNLIRALDGFGLTGGGSYTKTEIAPTPGGDTQDLPGYSRWVANGTAYFEKWGLNLRGSVRYRSTFLGELIGFGGGRNNRRARDEMIVDGQIGYDFSKDSALNGLSIYVQGQNLTNEPFVTEAGGELQVIDYQKYGRRYLAGATFKF